jgi:hypothetical protein
MNMCNHADDCLFISYLSLSLRKAVHTYDELMEAAKC